MPNLIESPYEEWIYKSFCNNCFSYDTETQMYKYSNPKYPNRKYQKTYNPKQFMVRGDVMNFNGHYRNENKMIFDGTKLIQLYTKIDDYGSVPPEFVCGDLPEEFNIGDFEKLIDHNFINWLSKDTLKKIEINKVGNEICGKVSIKGKTWQILFNLDNLNSTEFETNWKGSPDKLSDYVIGEINKLIDNYDNVDERRPFHREGNSLLEMYI